MGVREGRAFSSDLHSPNESFRISFHFKERMPSPAPCSPSWSRRAGRSGVNPAHVEKEREGAHSPSPPAGNSPGSFQSGPLILSCPAPTERYSGEQPDPQAELARLAACSPRPGLGAVSGVQGGRVAPETVWQSSATPHECGSSPSPGMWGLGL